MTTYFLGTSVWRDAVGQRGLLTALAERGVDMAAAYEVVQELVAAAWDARDESKFEEMRLSCILLKRWHSHEERTT